MAVELTVREQGAVVRAGIVDGVKRAFNVEQNDTPAVDKGQLAVSRGQLMRRAEAYQVAAGGSPADKAYVGGGEIQSLADLANGLDMVRTMRVAPITNDPLCASGCGTFADPCR